MVGHRCRRRGIKQSPHADRAPVSSGRQYSQGPLGVQQVPSDPNAKWLLKRAAGAVPVNWSEFEGGNVNAVSRHWSYLTAVFVLSYLWQLILYLTGGIESRLFPILMLFPLLVAVAFRVAGKEGFRNVGWGLRRWWYLIPTVLIPAIVILGISLLALSLGWATWSNTMFLFREGTVEIRQLPMWIGPHTESVALFGLSFVLSLFVQSALGSVVTFGEEFGWRGYVQEKLLRAYGVNRGLVLLGVIWGLWHLPIGLMGWNFPDHPVLGALVLTPLGTVFMGIYLGWLYLRSRSIWMPTVAHAAMNLSASVLFIGLEARGGDLPLQLVWIAAWGVVAAFCMVSLNRYQPVLWQNRRPATADSNDTPAD